MAGQARRVCGGGHWRRPQVSRSDPQGVPHARGARQCRRHRGHCFRRWAAGRQGCQACHQFYVSACVPSIPVPVIKVTGGPLLQGCCARSAASCKTLHASLQVSEHAPCSKLQQQLLCPFDPAFCLLPPSGCGWTATSSQWTVRQARRWCPLPLQHPASRWCYWRVTTSRPSRRWSTVRRATSCKQVKLICEQLLLA